MTLWLSLLSKALYKRGIEDALTRVAIPAMQQTTKDILKYHRAKEVDYRLMPIKQIITLIDEL